MNPINYTLHLFCIEMTANLKQICKKMNHSQFPSLLKFSLSSSDFQLRESSSENPALSGFSRQHSVFISKPVSDLYVTVFHCVRLHCWLQQYVPFVVCLVVPRPKQLKALAVSLGVHTDDWAEQCKNKAIQDAVLKDLQALGKACK